MNTLPAVLEIHGEVLDDAVVTAEQMARMNEAREAFKELRTILMFHAIPAMGGFSHPLATEIESRLEMVIFRSQNFLYPHRHMGASHGAYGKRPGIDVEVRP